MGSRASKLLEEAQKNHSKDVNLKETNLKSLPIVVCTNFNYIVKLNLNDNLIKEIPPDIYKMRSLKILWMSNNKLVSIADEVGLLSELEELHVDGNSISRIGKVFFELKKIRDLSLARNALKEVPSDMVHPKLLKNFNSFLSNTLLFEKETSAKRLIAIFNETKKKNRDDLEELLKLAQNAPKPILPLKPMDGTSISLLDLSTIEVARQMALIDQSLLARISAKELLSKKWSSQHVGNIETCPNIINMIQVFNNGSQWVASEIVQERSSKQRLKRLKFFLDVARHCFEMNNYNGLMMVVSGLSSSSVGRLKGTWGSLSSRRREQFEEMERFVNMEGEPHVYRAVWQTPQFCQEANVDLAESFNQHQQQQQTSTSTNTPSKSSIKKEKEKEKEREKSAAKKEKKLQQQQQQNNTNNNMSTPPPKLKKGDQANTSSPAIMSSPPKEGVPKLEFTLSSNRFTPISQFNSLYHSVDNSPMSSPRFVTNNNNNNPKDQQKDSSSKQPYDHSPNSSTFSTIRSTSSYLASTSPPQSPPSTPRGGDNSSSNYKYPNSPL
ncbi:hypothetical protein DFA_06786 [Cavenderia fasciculata]|uniref:Ras-GEF domain-containing protein n=1 Tax=Cavenderia fasciculata TaxID=261658 RepID=F4Q299_CACFS|nr:uncharacterized protein DFA_06786 [Cavenderia fasciculata]EGG18119.1 hypothetical protein DFA_06786 [Cavenderia fasciculata]|eukprot:XP_004366160.1 hypothetical protein DFA_06786 [Cavenderia fasciculata]